MIFRPLKTQSRFSSLDNMGGSRWSHYFTFVNPTKSMPSTFLILAKLDQICIFLVRTSLKSSFEELLGACTPLVWSHFVGPLLVERRTSLKSAHLCEPATGTVSEAGSFCELATEISISAVSLCGTVTNGAPVSPLVWSHFVGPLLVERQDSHLSETLW